MKLQPKQLSAADLSGGLVNFSEFFKAIEKAKGKVEVSEIIPKLQKQPQDDVDMIIWCAINYVRRLLGMKGCKYEEIYGFYDEMVQQAQAESQELEGDDIDAEF